MRIAVVGSGVSGLAAAWLLNAFTDHEVHIFEAESRPGGHANTVTFSRTGKEDADVDTGFIVFNPSTYPNFIRFLKMYPDLAERVLPTEMTFSVSRDGGDFEWAGNDLMSVFCQPSRLLDPDMWRLLYDVLRFNANAQRMLLDLDHRDVHDGELSIGNYVKQHGYSDSFRDNYLIPMTAAIWSTPPDKCALDFPARTLIQFMFNHHLLQITGKPSWLTLRGGSRTYVQKIVSMLMASRVHLSTPIRAARTVPSFDNPERTIQVLLDTASGETLRFDEVIMACHTDTTVDILKAGGGMTPEETRILEAFNWNKNEAVLHSDERLMPKSRLAWSCWNYLTKSVVNATGQYMPNVNQVSLTYWMNELQHLPTSEHGPILVTLNPPFDPKPELEFGRYKYDHPILSTEAIKAQAEIPSIQRTRGISYAGAWLKYGFHEDGFTAGLRAAAALAGPDVKVPFAIVDADRKPSAAVVWLARAFDVLEMSGASAVVGTLFVWWLAILRTVLGRLGGVDLSHIRGQSQFRRGVIDVAPKTKMT